MSRRASGVVFFYQIRVRAKIFAFHFHVSLGNLNTNEETSESWVAKMVARIAVTALWVRIHTQLKMIQNGQYCKGLANLLIAAKNDRYTLELRPGANGVI